ncbi:MAG: T9SS type A sorting domain-containing protein [Bacteroidetes bacterium]|nr:T9SS type A sorting domain-containing protein [Bacteroidota bacterium]
MSLLAADLPYSWRDESITTFGTHHKTATAADGCDSVHTLVLTQEIPVAQQPALARLGARLYPNPAGQAVRLQVATTAPHTLVLRDTQGRTVLVTRLSGSLHYDLGTASLVPGLYTVELRNAEGFAYSRLVRQ